MYYLMHWPVLPAYFDTKVPNDNFWGATSRGISTSPYASGYHKLFAFDSEADFIGFIKGKRVLDHACGTGLFACEAAHRELDTEIFSFSPTLAYKDNVNGASTKKMLHERLGLEIDSPEMQSVLKQFFDKAHALDWVNLVPYLDESFDLILSSYGFSYHIEADPQRRLRALAEIDRVLKPGGELRFTPIMDQNARDLLLNSIEELDLTDKYKIIFKPNQFRERNQQVDGWVLCMKKLNHDTSSRNSQFTTATLEARKLLNLD